MDGRTAAIQEEAGSALFTRSGMMKINKFKLSRQESRGLFLIGRMGNWEVGKLGNWEIGRTVIEGVGIYFVLTANISKTATSPTISELGVCAPT